MVNKAPPDPTAMPHALHALSPLDGRYSEHTRNLAQFFSEYALIRYRVRVEIQWLQHLAAIPDLTELPPFDDACNKLLNDIVESFSDHDALHIKHIEQSLRHDVKAVEYFLREKFSPHPALKKAIPFVHFACTSDDINNLAYSLMLCDAQQAIVLPTLATFNDSLTALAQKYAGQPMLARTHGQPASPTTMGKEMAVFAYRLYNQRQQLQSHQFCAKMNGAVGNYNAHFIAYPNLDWQKICQNFVTHMGLQWTPLTTQIEPHDRLAEWCHIMLRINTIAIDTCRDMWGYIALNYFTQKKDKREVGSSTMPHKINPIDFENAEGNLGVANAMLTHLAEKLPISRWQRDLSDSTAERNIGIALGHTLIAWRSIHRGLSHLKLNERILADDLEAHPQVLGEAVSTVLRRYGELDAYEQVKKLIHDSLTVHTLRDFIDNHPTLPHSVKAQLNTLVPKNYCGNAVQQVQDFVTLYSDPS